MAIIRTLTRTAATAAEPAVRGLQQLMDPDAGSERFTALDRRLDQLESRLGELADLDRRVAALVGAELERTLDDRLETVLTGLSTLTGHVGEIRDDLEKIRDDLEHVRTEQAAARATQ